MDTNRIYTWPYAIGGFVGPLLALIFERWFPSYVAFSIAFFVVFATVFGFIARRSGRSLLRALIASAAGAAVGTLILVLTGCVAERHPLTAPITELQPEEPATVHLGSLAAVRVDSNRHYIVGSAGTSLTLVKQAADARTTVYVYRAETLGNQMFVLTPRDPGPDGCISCVTVHYFVTVAR